MANEKRLIDANAFGSFLLGKMGFNPASAEMVLQWMDEYTKKNTVDAVEVVRCKDCKYWHEETAFCEKHSRFDSFGMDWNMFAEEDFCSFGERKDNG